MTREIASASERAGWQRAAAAGGAVSVLLVIVSGALESGLPRANASAAKIAAYYASRGHWHRIQAGVIVGGLSMLFFLWFLAALHARLRAVEAGEQRVASMALAAGVAFTALFGVLNALRGVIGEVLARSTPFREQPLDPQLVRLVAEIGVLVFAAALVVGAVLIAATSVIALRSGVPAPWVGWAGALMSLIVLAGAFPYPSVVVYLLLLWVLIVSVAIATESRQPQTDHLTAA
jgi:hypothetical protein